MNGWDFAAMVLMVGGITPAVLLVARGNAVARLNREEGRMLAATKLLGYLMLPMNLIDVGAERFLDRAGFLVQALHGVMPTAVGDAVEMAWTWSGLVLGLLSAALAMAIGFAGMHFGLGRLRPVLKAPLHVVHRLHSGHVGDYAAWLLCGMATVGALFALG